MDGDKYKTMVLYAAYNRPYYGFFLDADRIVKIMVNSGRFPKNASRFEEFKRMVQNHMALLESAPSVVDLSTQRVTFQKRR